MEYVNHIIKYIYIRIATARQNILLQPVSVSNTKNFVSLIRDALLCLGAVSLSAIKLHTHLWIWQPNRKFQRDH